MANDRWIEVSDSQFDHEREGLEHLHAAMPDEPPLRVWTNFEFRDEQGGWHEVDALVLGRDALYLVELKHYHGTITGNDRTWQRHGRAESSPLLLARRKAQYLASKLKAEFVKLSAGSFAGPARRVIPWVQPVVFLHHPQTDVALPEPSRVDLYGLDELAGEPGALPGISELFELRLGRNDPIGPNQEAILVHLLGQIGLVQRREREVGSWSIVEGGAIAEGEGWQDWEASGRETGAPARIRFLTYTTPEELQTAEVIAQHEFTLMRRLHHDALIRPIDLVRDKHLGRGIVYDWDRDLQRLDLWLEEHREDADLAQRLDIIQQVGEVLDYAHGRGVAHRRLSPRAVWIGPPERADGPLTVKVSDWHASGSVDDGASRPGITRVVARSRNGMDAELGAYEAPEGAWAAGAADRPGLDQFSLGALAFYVLTGLAPAPSAQDLLFRLRSQGGIDIAGEIPELPKALRKTILKATSPAPRERHESIRQFLAALQQTDEQITVDAPDHDVTDPREAVRGTQLAGGRFTVLSRLGKGSTALGLLVEDADAPNSSKRRVLKVALDERAQRRLVDEAEVLRSIKSRRVAALYEGPITLGPTTALLLQNAGDMTLRDVIRSFDGGMPLDFLELYGNDLLSAMEDLDRLGIDHRDIKPANLGVGKNSSKNRHLTLFDFSLSRAAASEIDAGTAPYLDPFLGEGGRDVYDSAAERYAAAVVLYEMATGRLPVYGDDPQANPAAITADVTLDPADFPTVIAADLQDFFTSALARKASDRFGTITQMRDAWARMFGEGTTSAPSGADDIAAQVNLDTPLEQAGFSPRALTWLTRKGFATVEDVVVMDPLKFGHMPGVPQVSRKEIQDRAKAWRERFKKTAKAARTTDAAVAPIERIAEILVEAAKGHRSAVHGEVLQLVLGPGSESVDAFASQVTLAAMLSVSRSQVKQALLDLHEDWLADEKAAAALGGFTAALDEVIDEAGGVVALCELVTDLLRRAGHEEPHEPETAIERTTKGLVRLVSDGRRYRLRGQVDTLAPINERRRGEEVVAIGRNTAVLDVAVALGEAVSAGIAQQTGVRTAERSRELISAVMEKADVPPDSLLRVGHRALRLGAAMAHPRAAVTPLGELYRLDLLRHDALRIALGEVRADERLSPAEIRHRFRARFPALKQLPWRPQLDTVIADAEVGLRFDKESAAYVGPTRHGVSTMLTDRASTITAAELADAEDGRITRRLSESRTRRSYLVLGAEPSRVERLHVALQHRFQAKPLAVAPVLLTQMRHVVEGLGPKLTWERILQADTEAPGSREHQAVTAVVERALPAVLERIHQALAADEAPVDDRAPLVLTDVEVLVRYGQVSVLRKLSDLSVSRGRAVWVTIPQYSIHTGPQIDDVQLTTSPHQFVEVDPLWIDTFARAEPVAALPEQEDAQ